nr:M13 family metallopeptidase N-terminal domain-containing protein [Chromobacterium sp. ASV5]
MQGCKWLPAALALSVSLAWAGDGAVDYGRYGIDFKGIDHSVRIQDNISLYANGAWLKRAVIPPERSSTGVAETLFEQNQQRIRAIIEHAAGEADAAPDARKIADLYRSFMDETRIARQGLAPLRPQLRAIAGLSTPAEALRYMGRLQDQPVDTPFRFYVAADARDSSSYLAGVGQSGLSMERDYYLENAPAFVSARKAYLAYLTRLLRLAGEPDAARRARAVLALSLIHISEPTRHMHVSRMPSSA